MKESNKLPNVATEASPLLSYERSGNSSTENYTRVGEAAKKCLLTHFPIASWLPNYTFTSLVSDVIAGLTVGLMVVPQGLAYATIAGLPVQYGLYSAYLGCFVYCVFGGSKDITLGPTAIMSLMVARYANGCPSLAVAETLFCGIIQFTLGLLKLGFVVRFISLPVISGFVSAAAITIGFGQVKNLLGLTNIKRAFYLCVYETFENIGKTHLWDLALGLVCIVLLAVLKKLNRIKWNEDKDDTTLQRVCRKFLWIVSTGRNALVVIFAAAVAKAVESAGVKNLFSLTAEVEPGIPKFKVMAVYGIVSFSFCRTQPMRALRHIAHIASGRVLVKGKVYFSPRDLGSHKMNIKFIVDLKIFTKIFGGSLATDILCDTVYMIGSLDSLNSDCQSFSNLKTVTVLKKRRSRSLSQA